MNRLQAAALVVVLWAAIYLPGLGSTELKGEEGRRILPAVTMLETGNWLVPYVGGRPFLRKPPLVNWMIAASFNVTGLRNEWTARLPSALCVLALGLTIVGTSGAGWLSPGAAFVAALMAMTQFGLLAKARFAGAEIEGIYAPISGMAMVCWLAWWLRGRSPWLNWLVPGALLGVACLAKGPSLHLLFFAALVLGVVGATRAWRRLWHPAVFAGLLLGAAIFAAWAVPYFQAPETAEAAAVWKRQGIERFTESEFDPGNYFTNLPRALLDQLPWLVLLPLLPVAWHTSDRNRAAMRGVAFATAGAFLLVLLIPGTLPRYVLPLGSVLSVLLAWALEARPLGEVGLRRWHHSNAALASLLILAAFAAPLAAGAAVEAPDLTVALRRLDWAAALRAGLASAAVLALAAVILARRPLGLTVPGLAAKSGALFGGAMLLYSAAAVPWINQRDTHRPLARAVDAAVPRGQTLFLYNPGYFAAAFYLQTPVRYAPTTDKIPAIAEWLLAPAKDQQRLAEKQPEFVLVQVLAGKRAGEFLLLQRSAELQKLPPR